MGGVEIMEKGFYHAQRGYWQAIGGADVSRYPSGTVEVPIRPSADHEWNGNAWRPITRTPAEQEARRQANAARQIASLNSGAIGLLVDLIFQQSQNPQPTKAAMLQVLRDDLATRGNQ